MLNGAANMSQAKEPGYSAGSCPNCGISIGGVEVPVVSVSYRKTASARKSYALYTADRPASWDVLVDGVVRGSLVGGSSKYSRDVYYVVHFDGRRVRQRPGPFRDAKRVVDAAIRYGADAPAWFYSPESSSDTGANK
jgi:hypothetical protein